MILVHLNVMACNLVVKSSVNIHFFFLWRTVRAGDLVNAGCHGNGGYLGKKAFRSPCVDVAGDMPCRTRSSSPCRQQLTTLQSQSPVIIHSETIYYIQLLNNRINNYQWRHRQPAVSSTLDPNRAHFVAQNCCCSETRHLLQPESTGTSWDFPTASCSPAGRQRSDCFASSAGDRPSNNKVESKNNQ